MIGRTVYKPVATDAFEPKVATGTVINVFPYELIVQWEDGELETVDPRDIDLHYDDAYRAAASAWQQANGVWE